MKYQCIAGPIKGGVLGELDRRIQIEELFGGEGTLKLCDVRGMVSELIETTTEMHLAYAGLIRGHEAREERWYNARIANESVLRSILRAAGGDL